MANFDKNTIKEFLSKSVKKVPDWLFQNIPYISLFLIALIFLYIIIGFADITFQGLPTTLNSIIATLPTNNNGVYPILLQSLIIASSMVFGFYGILVFYATEKFNKRINKSTTIERYHRILAKIFYTVFILLPLFILIFSIFFSLNGLAYYGLLTTYTTEQISTGHVPLAINSSYFNNTNSTYQGQAKNYTKTTQTYYNKLLANAQGSVKDIFLSLEIISGLLIAYIMEIFEVFELIFKSRRNLTTSGILFILAICVFGYIFGFYNIVEHIIEFFAVILFIALILFFINRKNKNQIINNPIKPNPPLPPPSNPI